MGVVLDTVEWLITLGFGALLGVIGGIVVVDSIAFPLSGPRARILLLVLFAFAGMFTTGSVFALAVSD